MRTKPTSPRRAVHTSAERPQESVARVLRARARRRRRVVQLSYCLEAAWTHDWNVAALLREATALARQRSGPRLAARIAAWEARVAAVARDRH